MWISTPGRGRNRLSHPARGARGPAAQGGQVGVPGRHLPVLARGPEVDENRRLQPIDSEWCAPEMVPEHRRAPWTAGVAGPSLVSAR